MSKYSERVIDFARAYEDAWRQQYGRSLPRTPQWSLVTEALIHALGVGNSDMREPEFLWLDTADGDVPYAIIVLDDSVLISHVEEEEGRPTRVKTKWVDSFSGGSYSESLWHEEDPANAWNLECHFEHPHLSRAITFNLRTLKEINRAENVALRQRLQGWAVQEA